jgi:hypothetical protein
MTYDRLLYCLRRPVYSARLLSYKFREIVHRNEPWISYEAVRYCETTLRRDQVGLEWGSGRSTKWFAQRLGRLLSVEFDPHWHGKVTKMAKGLANVECRFVPLEHPLEEPTARDYDPVPAYVRVADEFADNNLDFVVVDGHYRCACVKQILKKIKPGGLLLIDNTDWMELPEWGVPASWTVVHQSRNFATQTTIWRKPQE